MCSTQGTGSEGHGCQTKRGGGGEGALSSGSPPTVFVAGDGNVVHGAQLEAGAGEDLQLHRAQHTGLDICREHTHTQASGRPSYPPSSGVVLTTASSVYEHRQCNTDACHGGQRLGPRPNLCP